MNLCPISCDSNGITRGCQFTVILLFNGTYDGKLNTVNTYSVSFGVSTSYSLDYHVFQVSHSPVYPTIQSQDLYQLNDYIKVRVQFCY